MPLCAFGSNGSGQLGVGHTNDLSTPELVQGSDSWSIKQLAAGGNHTVILCSDGKVRATGNNEDSRACICGRSAYTFMEMPLWEYNYGGTMEVEQVACTWSATFLLLADGKMFVCGTGSSGELGLGEGVVGSRVLRRVPDFPPADLQVLKIGACMGHVVTVLSDGTVYGWGKGRKGQLGEPAQDVWRPRKFEDVSFSATDVACGKDFTALIGDRTDSEILIFGPKGSDRFGIQSEVPIIPSSLRTMTASWGSMHFLREDGSIQSWGRDDHGQLPPDGLPEIVSHAAGSEHVLALTRSGQVLAWGWGEHGNCGNPTDQNGDVKGRWNEIRVSDRATHVFAGCATSFIGMAD